MSKKSAPKGYISKMRGPGLYIQYQRPNPFPNDTSQKNLSKNMDNFDSRSQMLREEKQINTLEVKKLFNPSSRGNRKQSPPTPVRPVKSGSKTPIKSTDGFQQLLSSFDLVQNDLAQRRDQQERMESLELKNTEALHHSKDSLQSLRDTFRTPSTSKKSLIRFDSFEPNPKAGVTPQKKERQNVPKSLVYLPGVDSLTRMSSDNHASVFAPVLKPSNERAIKSMQNRYTANKNQRSPKTSNTKRSTRTRILFNPPQTLTFSDTPEKIIRPTVGAKNGVSSFSIERKNSRNILGYSEILSPGEANTISTNGVMDKFSRDADKKTISKLKSRVGLTAQFNGKVSEARKSFTRQSRYEVKPQALGTAGKSGSYRSLTGMRGVSINKLRESYNKKPYRETPIESNSDGSTVLTDVSELSVEIDMFLGRELPTPSPSPPAVSVDDSTRQRYRLSNKTKKSSEISSKNETETEQLLSPSDRHTIVSQSLNKFYRRQKKQSGSQLPATPSPTFYPKSPHQSIPSIIRSNNSDSSSLAFSSQASDDEDEESQEMMSPPASSVKQERKLPPNIRTTLEQLVFTRASYDSVLREDARLKSPIIDDSDSGSESYYELVLDGEDQYSGFGAGSEDSDTAFTSSFASEETSEYEFENRRSSVTDMTSLPVSPVERREKVRYTIGSGFGEDFEERYSL